MSEHKEPIPSMIYNASVGGHVTNSQQIIDEVLNKEQSVLNVEQQELNKGILEEKEYTLGSNNGMGRVVLRKNIVEGINILTQDMINKSNTIYVIQYDFTLGENLTVPSNCVLEFDGGSLSGDGTGKDTITFNNTLIKANAVKIFDISLSFNGRLADERGHIRWFGASPDKADNTNEVQKVIDCFNIVFIDRYTYKIRGVNLTKAHTIAGLEEQFVNSCGFTFIDNITGNPTLITPIFNDSNPYLLFKNIGFWGNITNNSYQPNTIAIDTSNAMSIRVYNCVFQNIEIPLSSNYNSYYNYIEKCRFHNFKWAFYKFHANNLNIIGNQFNKFEKAIYKTIGNGPINVRNNSFEEFTEVVFENDYYIYGFNLNFEENYIESYRCDTILKGWVGNVTSIGNLIQIIGRETVGSIDCIYNVKDCKSLISMNNTINLKNIIINQYVKYDYSTDQYRTIQLAILKDNYDDGGNVDLTSYVNFNVAFTAKQPYLLEGYDFITKRVYSNISDYSISPGEGYTWAESDHTYAKYWVTDNVIYFTGTLKKDSTTITEGKTNIAHITGDLMSMFLTHNDMSSSYPETDKIYIKAMDTSYNQIILLLHISTGIIDFIKGDTTKDIIFDGSCATVPRQ